MLRSDNSELSTKKPPNQTSTRITYWKGWRAWYPERFLLILANSSTLWTWQDEFQQLDGLATVPIKHHWWPTLKTCARYESKIKGKALILTLKPDTYSDFHIQSSAECDWYYTTKNVSSNSIKNGVELLDLSNWVWEWPKGTLYLFLIRKISKLCQLKTCVHRFHEKCLLIWVKEHTNCPR